MSENAADSRDLTIGEIEEQEAWQEHGRERIEQMAAERSAASCTGSSECEAVTHIHGCFADKGNCDHPSEHGDAAVSLGEARRAWIDERVERYAASLCSAHWHDEGHSFHSSCYTCDEKFMRRSVVTQERRSLEHFTKQAEAYAREVGLIDERVVDGIISGR